MKTGRRRAAQYALQIRKEVIKMSFEANVKASALKHAITVLQRVNDEGIMQIDGDDLNCVRIPNQTRDASIRSVTCTTWQLT